MAEERDAQPSDRLWRIEERQRQLEARQDKLEDKIDEVATRKQNGLTDLIKPMFFGLLALCGALASGTALNLGSLVK